MCTPLFNIQLVLPGIFVFTKILRFILKFCIIIMVLLGSPNELILLYTYLCDYYTECGHMSDWIMNFMLFRAKTCILQYHTITHYLLLKDKFIIFFAITCDNLILYNKKQTHNFVIYRVKLNDIKTSVVVLSLGFCLNAPVSATKIIRLIKIQ